MSIELVRFPGIAGLPVAAEFDEAALVAQLIMAGGTTEPLAEGPHILTPPGAQSRTHEHLVTVLDTGEAIYTVTPRNRDGIVVKPRPGYEAMAAELGCQVVRLGHGHKSAAIVRGQISDDTVVALEAVMWLP